MQAASTTRATRAGRTTGAGHHDRAAEILRGVLQGRSYTELAARFDVTKSMIESRAKHLAVELCRQGLLPGVAEHHLTSAQAMRRHAPALLSALHEVSSAPRGPSQASLVALTDEAVHRAIARLRMRSPCAERDIALLSLTLSTGAWPLEVARLEVRDYLHEDGCVREQSTLRAEAAANGRSRPLFFSAPRTQQALDAYLETRPLLGGGGPSASLRTAYRGLDPCSRLFLADDGQGLVIAESTSRHGGKRHLCRGIQALYKNLFRRADLKGLTITMIRRRLANRMADLGADLDQIALVMGVMKKNDLKEWLNRPPPPLEAIVRQLL